MKRTIALTMLLSILLTFTACLNQETNETTSPVTEAPVTTEATTSTTDEASVPIGEIAQLPMLSISLPVVRDTALAENGDEIFNLIYQNIAMVTPEPEIADKIILDFLNRTISISQEASVLENDAKAAYTSGENWMPYLYQHTFEPMRIDSGILSLTGTYATYSGSAHPDVSTTAITYSMVTGEVLTLDDILLSDVSSDALCSLVISALEQQKDVLYEGYEDTVKERFSSSFMQDSDWYLSENGLCYYFSPREIAGYVSGVITAEIPYSELVGIMDDSRFPAEQDICTGSIKALEFDNADLGEFNQFTEVTIDSDSQKVLLYTNGSLRNIRLESGYWNADGSVFTPEFTQLMVSTLTPGDAIMIETELADTLPTLRLTYQADGELITTYLSKSIISGK